MPALFGAIVSFLIFALLVYLVLLIVEWVAGTVGVPANILLVIRVIFALIVLVYLLGFLFGNAETLTLPLFRGH